MFRSYFRHDGSQSDAFDDGGNTLADADAHGAKCPFHFASFQLPSSGQHQPRTAHPKRMPEGDSASVRIDMFPILQQAEVAQHRDALGGESFVKFDDVDLSDIDIELRQKLPRRRHRTNAHHAGSDSSRGDAHYPRPDRQAGKGRRVQIEDKYW